MGTKLELLLSYLEDSLMLSTPLIENDPAFQQIKEDIPSIIEMSMISLGKENFDELSNKEIHLVCLKSQYTIYLRLATASAPEFDVSAEQVSFKKGDRFFHYTSLAEKISTELKTLEIGDVEVVQVVIGARNGTIRNYNLSKPQNLNFKVNSVNPYSVELSWKMYNTSLGQFKKYTLMYSEKPIYDEYAIPKFRSGNDVKVLDFYDIKRTKLRLSDLKPNTKYYLVLTFHSRDGGSSTEQIEVQTGESYE